MAKTSGETLTKEQIDIVKKAHRKTSLTRYRIRTRYWKDFDYLRMTVSIVPTFPTLNDLKYLTKNEQRKAITIMKDYVKSDRTHKPKVVKDYKGNIMYKTSGWVYSYTKKLESKVNERRTRINDKYDVNLSLLEKNLVYADAKKLIDYLNSLIIQQIDDTYITRTVLKRHLKAIGTTFGGRIPQDEVIHVLRHLETLSEEFIFKTLLSKRVDGLYDVYRYEDPGDDDDDIFRKLFEKLKVTIEYKEHDITKKDYKRLDKFINEQIDKRNTGRAIRDVFKFTFEEEGFTTIEDLRNRLM